MPGIQRHLPGMNAWVPAFAGTNGYWADARNRGGSALRNISSCSAPSERCELEQDPAADFVGILLGAIAEDHDAELVAQHHPDIGGRVVETAVLFGDGRRVPAEDLPGQRLPVARPDGPDALVRQVHRLAQRPLERQLAEIGGEKYGHIARRGIHLARARPAVVALLTARLSERLATLGVALHRAALVFGGHASARAVILARQCGRRHAERPQQPLLDQLVDRHAVSTLERKL